MVFSAFCGPSATERSIVAGSDLCVNWRPSLIQIPQGKARYTLYRTEGVGLFVDSGIASSSRAAFWQNGRCFFVIGGTLVEVFTGGTVTVRGTGIAEDDHLARIEANTTQLMVLSAGHGYILTLATNAFAEITSEFPTGDAVGLASQDGYAMVGIRDTNRFALSNINNWLTWDAGDQSTAEAKPDFIRNLISIREQLWIFKEKSTQPFSNTGADFPFTPNQGELIEYGIVAPDSLAKVDNALFCVAGDANGIGIVARSIGYKLQRVSTDAMEQRLAEYPTLADAEGQAFYLGGHTAYRVTFPSANSGYGATWEMDVNTGDWIETPYWNSKFGREESHRARVYVAAFGKILCGDRAAGKIYELGMQYLDDNGEVIRRRRRAPHLVNERKQIFYDSLRFDGNTGIGLNVASGELGYNPAMNVSWSDNGGRTFGQAREVRFGKFGAFDIIPEMRAMGMGRDRVIDTIVTDPVDWCIAAVYVNSGAGSR